MENNLDVSRSPKPDFPNKDIEVAHILIEFPSLICQSNLTRHHKVWGKKARRSAKNVSPSASAIAANSSKPMEIKEVVSFSSMIREAPRVPSEFMRKSREDFEIFEAAMTLQRLKHAPENPKPEKVPLIEQDSRKEHRMEKNIYTEAERGPRPIVLVHLNAIKKLRKLTVKQLENLSVLIQEIEKVKIFHQQLKDYNQKLKARRKELYKNNQRCHCMGKPSPDQNELQLLHEAIAKHTYEDLRTR